MPIATINVNRLDLKSLMARYFVKPREYVLGYTGLDELGIHKFPTSEHLAQLGNHVLTAQCHQDARRALYSSSAYRKRCEDSVILHEVTEQAPEWVRNIRANFAKSKDRRFLSMAAMECYAQLEALFKLLAFAYQDETEPADSRGIFPRDAKQVQRLWRNTSRFLPRSLLDDIVQLDPTAVFLQGTFPTQLPRAIALACQLRARLKTTKIFLTSVIGSLYVGLPAIKKEVLAEPRFFDFFDGIVIHPDIQTLTTYDIASRLRTRRSLVGLENVVYRHHGSVCYDGPSRHTRERFVGGAGYPACTQDSDRTGAAAIVPGTHPLRTALVVPILQRCYWSRCDFCPTCKQFAIVRDPLLERRGREAAAILPQVAGWAEMAWFGFNMLPPKTLKSLVDTLVAQDNRTPWAFEGKFGTFYTPDFVARLQKAGCRGITFGLETPSDRLNARYHKHVARIDTLAIERIITQIDRAGIAVNVNSISNLPGATSADVSRHAWWLQRMSKRLRLFHFSSSDFKIYAGSRMAAAPLPYGIEIAAPKSVADAFSIDLPFRIMDGEALPRTPWMLPWLKTYGCHYSPYGRIDLLHSYLHGYTGLTYFDATMGRNIFKELRERLAIKIKDPESRFRLAKTVRVDCADLKNGGKIDWLVDRATGQWTRTAAVLWEMIHPENDGKIVWLIDRATGQWIWIDGNLWEIVNRQMGPRGKSFATLMKTVAKSERAACWQTLQEMVGCGLLVPANRRLRSRCEG